MADEGNEKLITKYVGMDQSYSYRLFFCFVLFFFLSMPLDDKGN